MSANQVQNQNPKKIVKQLCKDLNTKETFYLKKIYEEEKIPRELSSKLRETKFKEIKKTASGKGIEVIDNMIKNEDWF